MANVYIINNSGHDFSKAEKFGKLEFLTEGWIAWHRLNVAYRQMAAKIEHSQLEDYLLLTGPTSICTVAAGLFGAKHRRVNLLIYNNKTEDYEKHIILYDNLLSI